MRKYWIARAARTRFLVNFAWWLSLVGPSLVGWSLFSAATWIGLRWAEVGLWSRVTLVGGGFFVSGLVAYLLARPRFFGVADALVLLDRRLALDGALISAAERDRDWPPPAKERSDGLRYRWRRSWWLPPLAFGIFVLAVLVPIAPRAPERPKAALLPPAWEAAKEGIEALERAEVFADAPLEAWKDELEKLERSPAGDWYQDAHLEAGDRLLEDIQGAAERAGEGFEAAESGLFGDPAAKDAREADWKLAENKLEGGTLELDPELAKRIANLDPKRVAQLSPAERQALEEKLAAGREAAAKASGGKGRKGTPKKGEGSGVARGPGAAPLELSGDESELEARPERVDSDDLRRAALGDPAGVTRHSHEVETGEQLGVSGGNPSSIGKGGESVHRVAATPEEQAFLRRYFE